MREFISSEAAEPTPFASMCTHNPIHIHMLTRTRTIVHVGKLNTQGHLLSSIRALFYRLFHRSLRAFVVNIHTHSSAETNKQANHVYCAAEMYERQMSIRASPATSLPRAPAPVAESEARQHPRLWLSQKHGSNHPQCCLYVATATRAAGLSPNIWTRLLTMMVLTMVVVLGGSRMNLFLLKLCIPLPSFPSRMNLFLLKPRIPLPSFPSLGKASAPASPQPACSSPRNASGSAPASPQPACSSSRKASAPASQQPACSLSHNASGSAPA